MKIPKDLITVREAATLLGVSTARVYQVIESGKLLAYQNAVGTAFLSERTVLARKAGLTAKMAKPTGTQ